MATTPEKRVSKPAVVGFFLALLIFLSYIPLIITGWYNLFAQESIGGGSVYGLLLITNFDNGAIPVSTLIRGVIRSSFNITTFIIIGIFIFASFLLNILALREIRKTNSKGTLLAKIGLFINLLNLVLLLLLIYIYFFMPYIDSFKGIPLA